ncbi:ribbon-helix-helix domain-containing protein [Enterococcus sp. BWR-S5]|uniref:ribbon-helix-helix domain-containing protein n=1 Tax=Enterococcus sp. BWR-S5 TaxID=2787714 RepID=UPI001924C06A|nr:Arc family DNA-binding protein [Enterococcus sp. BWR-S5]MBL1225062.1 Arc family DNA-binding protein [Enterococcus sp. BWR-S5]
MEGKEQKTKKQVPLRLSTALYNELAAWAEDEFRSVNGQIEYLLTEAVKRRKGSGKQMNSEE